MQIGWLATLTRQPFSYLFLSNLSDFGNGSKLTCTWARLARFPVIYRLRRHTQQFRHISSRQPQLCTQRRDVSGGLKPRKSDGQTALLM